MGQRQFPSSTTTKKLYLILINTIRPWLRLMLVQRTQCTNRPFATAAILTCYSRKAQVLLRTLTTALLYLSVPVSHDSVEVSQHAQNQDPLSSPVLFLLPYAKVSSSWYTIPDMIRCIVSQQNRCSKANRRVKVSVYTDPHSPEKSTNQTEQAETPVSGMWLSRGLYCSVTSLQWIHFH